MYRNIIRLSFLDPCKQFTSCKQDDSSHLDCDSFKLPAAEVKLHDDAAS
jgi:hypothetical protein